jgi:hypothetical protein
MSGITESQRAQVRACAVVMQSAADVLRDEYEELEWRLRTAAVAVYQQFPKPAEGELPQFDAELQRRIDEAVPCVGIAGVHEAVKGENKSSRSLLTQPSRRRPPGWLFLPPNLPNPAVNEAATDGSEAAPSLLSSAANWCGAEDVSHSHL